MPSKIKEGSFPEHYSKHLGYGEGIFGQGNGVNAEREANKMAESIDGMLVIVCMLVSIHRYSMEQLL